MTISSSNPSKKTYTKVSTNTETSISKVASSSETEYSKNNNLPQGVNTSGGVLGAGTFGKGRYGGLLHFRRRTKQSVSH